IHKLDERATQVGKTVAEPIEVVPELLAVAAQSIEFYRSIEFNRCVGHDVVSVPASRPNARTLHDPLLTEKEKRRARGHRARTVQSFGSINKVDTTFFRL